MTPFMKEWLKDPRWLHFSEPTSDGDRVICHLYITELLIATIQVFTEVHAKPARDTRGGAISYNSGCDVDVPWQGSLRTTMDACKDAVVKRLAQELENVGNYIVDK